MYKQKPKLHLFILIALFAISGGSAIAQGFVSTGPGSWAPPVTLPSIPVSAANLADGRVLTWAAYNSNNTYQPYGQDNSQTYTVIFNPANNQAEEVLVSSTQHDMFCPGAATLPNGDVFVNGGTSTARTSTYDALNSTWSMQAPMGIPRAYNSSTILSDGSVLTLGGSWAEETGCRRPDANTPESNCPDKTAEVWSQGVWQELSGIPADPLRTNDTHGLFRSDNHMWLFTVAGGDVIHAGPSKNMHLLDVSGFGSISEIGTRANDADAMNGNAVMYDIGKILITGGAPDYEVSSRNQNVIATENAHVIEYSNGNWTTTQVSDMAYERAYHNSVVLPNGEVVVFGGQRTPKPFSDDESVFVPELWNPDSNTFRPLAPMTIPRNYHSVALLLNDGRVLVGGGGLCGDCNTNHPDVEIFTPPYLLDNNGNPAIRPSIISAPSIMTYGDLIEVQTSSSVSSIVLMRTSAVTHSVNNDQRRVPLSFTNQENNVYHAQIPVDSGIVTPGNYMLYVLDQDGTPSHSEIVNIQSSNPSGGIVPPTDSDAPTATITSPFTDGQMLAPGAISLEGTASDTGDSGFKYVGVAVKDLATNQWFNFSNDSFTGATGNGSTIAQLQNTSLSSTDWSKSISLPNGNYRLAVRTTDNANNQSPWTTRLFSVTSDIESPTTTITYPLTDGQILAPGTISLEGIASDTGDAGFKYIGVAVKDLTTNQWYNFSNNSFTGATGNGSTIAQLQNTSLSSTDWSKSISLSNGNYRLAVRTTDNANNQSPWSIRQFTIASDNSLPTTTITSPSNNGQALSPGVISFQGTASDSGDSGFKYVGIALKDLATNQWYNFSNSSFTGASGNGSTLAQLQNTSASFTDWSKSITLSSGSYRLAVRTTDNARNQSPWIIRLFTVSADNEPPTTTITSPSFNGQVLAAGEVSLQGTASDTGGAGFKYVGIAVKDLTTNQWFNFSNNSFSGAFGNGSTTASLQNTSASLTDWSKSISLPDGNYRMAVRTTDNANNQSPWTIRTFSVDTSQNN